MLTDIRIKKGAMVMETDIDTPFVGVLMSQKQFMLSDVTNDKVPAATFTLKGAKTRSKSGSRPAGSDRPQDRSSRAAAADRLRSLDVPSVRFHGRFRPAAGG